MHVHNYSELIDKELLQWCMWCLTTICASTIRFSFTSTTTRLKCTHMQHSAVLMGVMEITHKCCLCRTVVPAKWSTSTFSLIKLQQKQYMRAASNALLYLPDYFEQEYVQQSFWHKAFCVCQVIQWYMTSHIHWIPLYWSTFVWGYFDQIKRLTQLCEVWLLCNQTFYMW